MTAEYATVILDVDSTVSGIEGIDWLAERRGPEVAARIVALTDEAMRGVIPLEAVYGRRLAEIRPTRADVLALSQSYIEAIAPDCADTVARLRAAGVRIVLISGGLRPAIEPLATHLGIDPSDLHAVGIRFDDRGVYVGYDESSPLTTSVGKRFLVERLDLPRPVLAMGDGATDAVVRGVVDRFAAYTGFARRENVVSQADVVIDSFQQLGAMVLDS